MSALFSFAAEGQENQGGSLFIKFDARSGFWTSGEDPVDMKKATVLVDIETMQTGWMRWQNGQPQREMTHDLKGKIAKPEDDDPDNKWKMAFEVDLIVDGERKVWSSTATGVLMGVNDLWALINANPQAGKLPHVKYTGATKKIFGKGQSHTPNFELVGWVDRPALSDSDDVGTVADDFN